MTLAVTTDSVSAERMPALTSRYDSPQPWSGSLSVFRAFRVSSR